MTVVVTVLYPRHAGARFDMAYYVEQHLPLVRRLLAPAGMRSLSYVRPVGDAPDHVLIAQLRFDSMAETEAGLAAHGPATQADIVNFTDIGAIVSIGQEVQA
jgi:uncharacterized protein (TIGR02118 family)